MDGWVDEKLLNGDLFSRVDLIESVVFSFVILCSNDMLNSIHIRSHGSTRIQVQLPAHP